MISSSPPPPPPSPGANPIFAINLGRSAKKPSKILRFLGLTIFLLVFSISGRSEVRLAADLDGEIAQLKKSNPELGYFENDFEESLQKASKFGALCMVFQNHDTLIQKNAEATHKILVGLWRKYRNNVGVRLRFMKALVGEGCPMSGARYLSLLEEIPTFFNAEFTYELLVASDSPTLDSLKPFILRTFPKEEGARENLVANLEDKCLVADDSEVSARAIAFLVELSNGLYQSQLNPVVSNSLPDRIYDFFIDRIFADHGSPLRQRIAGPLLRRSEGFIRRLRHRANQVQGEIKSFDVASGRAGLGAEGLRREEFFVVDLRDMFGNWLARELGIGKCGDHLDPPAP